MSDPVDDFWLSMVPDYQGKRFKSVTRGGADLDKIAGDDATAGEDAGKAEETPGIDGIVAFVRLTITDKEIGREQGRNRVCKYVSNALVGGYLTKIHNMRPI